MPTAHIRSPQRSLPQAGTVYHSFGMLMQGRNYSGGVGYRWGFACKEKDNDIALDYLNFGARLYNARIGKWLSVDPLWYRYPSFSPFGYAVNSPIIFSDPDGRDIIITNSALNSPYGTIVSRTIELRNQLSPEIQGVFGAFLNSERHLTVGYDMVILNQNSSLKPTATSSSLPNSPNSLITINSLAPLTQIQNHSTGGDHDANTIIELTDLNMLLSFVHELYHFDNEKFSAEGNHSGHENMANKSKSMGSDLKQLAKNILNIEIDAKDASILVLSGLENTTAYSAWLSEDPNNKDKLDQLKKQYLINTKLMNDSDATEYVHKISKSLEPSKDPGGNTDWREAKRIRN